MCGKGIRHGQVRYVGSSPATAHRSPPPLFCPSACRRRYTFCLADVLPIAIATQTPPHQTHACTTTIHTHRQAYALPQSLCEGADEGRSLPATDYSPKPPQSIFATRWRPCRRRHRSRRSTKRCHRPTTTRSSCLCPSGRCTTSYFEKQERRASTVLFTADPPWK